MKRGRKWILLLGSVLLITALIFFCTALFGARNPGEAYIGDFSTGQFNDNWHVSWAEHEQVVSLPIYLEDCKDTTVIMENTLPDTITDGMRLCMRSALQELRIYIDGEPRGAYTLDSFPYAGTHLPSSYVMVDLLEEDAGKPIRIQVTVVDRNKLNGISIGYGNNVWFSFLQENLPVIMAAILLAAVGLLAVVFYFLLRKRLHLSGAICFLGLTMVIAGLWILSESNIRQLIFRIPSYSSVFAYLLAEILGGFVALYFDEVQKHRYEKIYFAVQTLIFGQAAINVILAATGIAELYSTMILSHAWLIVGLGVSIVTVCIDVKTGRVKEYFITALGMVAFLVFCAFEMLEYYLKEFHILGKYLCIGFLVLLGATIVQAVTDEFKRIRVTIEKEKFQAELERKVDEQTQELRLQQQKISELFMETVMALSDAVDAKDRYTSGHSKRVAEYARMIAQRMGKDAAYQEEIFRAGLLHDVGKIRVPANIINKDGKLTEEEYNIIKVHPVTGYHILRGIEGSSHIAIAAKHHHERYDGSGYPNGLSGENIPEIARIVGVADAYDTMASNRSYRNAMPQDAIRSEFVKGRGTQFDPAIADIMLQMIDEDTQYAMKQPEKVEKKILVIDDDRTVYHAALDIMRSEPMYTVISAGSKEDALTLLEQQQFALILLDMKLPKAAGLDFLHAIHEQYHIPVILITEDKTQEISPEFEGVGCEDYITRSFMPLTLIEVVHTMTEKVTYRAGHPTGL